MISFIAVLVVALVVFVISIQYFSKKTVLSREATVQTEDLLFTMRMRETSYGLGEPIDLCLEVRNIGTEPVVLKFDQSLECDFLVQREVNMVFAKLPMSVWRYSASSGSKPQRHTVTLQPQEVKSYSTVWDQRDFNHRQVKPGNYIITGSVNISGQNTNVTLYGETRKGQ